MLGGAMGSGQPRPSDRPMPRYRPTPGYRFLPDYPQLPGYRPMPAERPAEYRPAGCLAALDHPPVPGYPALPPYLSIRDRPPALGWPAAVLGYLTVPLAVVPLVIYLGTLHGPRPARQHAAQAVNVWFTGVLYDLAAVIMAAMLALDSPRVALTAFAPLVAARWAVTLTYLARAARAAGRGMPYAFPSWLCMRIAR